MKEMFKKISTIDKKKYENIIAKVDCLEHCSMNIQKDCVVSFKNGTIVKTDVLDGNILLTNKKKEMFNLNDIVPDGFDLVFVKKDWKLDKKNKKIKVPLVFNEECLFLCLHEIGHAWDFGNSNEKEEDEIEFFKSRFLDKTKEEFCVKQVKQERSAWAWALKQWKNLVKLKFVEKKVFEEIPVDVAKAMLFSYANFYARWHIKNHSKFLNKDLN